MAIKSVQRTQIVLDGQVPEEKIRKILSPILDSEKFFNIRCEYKDNDETIVWLLPCKSYIIERARAGSETSYERVILVNGSMPKGFNMVEELWMPYRKKAKRLNQCTKYIVLGPHDVIEDEGTGRCVEIKMIMDGRCPESEVSEAFKAAIKYIAEELRKMAEEADPSDFYAARYLNHLSMLVAEYLEAEI